MNAKKCKSLRRLAAVATVGQKNRVYLLANREGTIRLSPLCTRGTYLAMKRRAA